METKCVIGGTMGRGAIKEGIIVFFS